MIAGILLYVQAYDIDSAWSHKRSRARVCMRSSRRLHNRAHSPKNPIIHSQHFYISPWYRDLIGRCLRATSNDDERQLIEISLQDKTAYINVHSHRVKDLLRESICNWKTCFGEFQARSVMRRYKTLRRLLIICYRKWWYRTSTGAPGISHT